MSRSRNPPDEAAPAAPPGFRAAGIRGYPRVAAPGLRASLPVGVALHVGAVALVASADLFGGSAADPPPLAHRPALRVLLAAPPAAAFRLGDPVALPDPERTRPTAPSSSPGPRPLDAASLFDLTPVAAPPADVYGFEDGIPEGLLDGLPGGVAEGVVGGVPDGLPGGAIGGMGRGADPLLPAPDEPPTPIRMPRPRFPTEALMDGLRGRVVLRALITERGAVSVLRVLRSVPGLDEEAIRVVEAEWRFRPALRNGRPVAALSDLVVRFALH